MARLKDIAAATSLTEATVSRVLRGLGQWSPETRQRVFHAAAQLKYRPNMLVQGIQTGRTQTIGVLLPIADDFFGRIFTGLHDALVQLEQVPILLWCQDQLAPSNQQPAHRPTELAQIHRLIDRRVDGVILRPVDDAVSDEYLRAVWERNIPLVTIDRELEHTHADFVGVDDHGIGREAARCLIGHGHRRLGHVAGPDSVTTARHRREGFEAAAAEAGVIRETLVDPKFGHARDIIADLLRRPDRPTAIFAANDQIAFNVMHVAREMGLTIPRDLSLIGCGNLRASMAVYPELTTFDQHPEQVGARSVDLLQQRLLRPDLPPRRLRLAAEMIERGSVARLHV